MALQYYAFQEIYIYILFYVLYFLSFILYYNFHGISIFSILCIGIS